MNFAVIFAGGTGERMNTKSRPKQFLEMHGKPVLIYTLEVFQGASDVDEIILVNLSNWMDYARMLVKKYHLSKVKKIVPGGKNGQESIFHGIEAAMKLSHDSKDIVLIHDGVRPLIDRTTIQKCVEAVHTNGSAITTAPAVETIFTNCEHDGHIGKIFDRSRCLMARAPQCFYLHDIYKAHLQAVHDKQTNFIDSAMLMQHYGAVLYAVPGPVENIKITTPTDFYIFRALLDARESMQIVGF